MKQKIIFSVILSTVAFISQAQVSPEQISATHSDSCWYFNFNYPTPKISSNKGTLIVTLILAQTIYQTTHERVATAHAVDDVCEVVAGR